MERRSRTGKVVGSYQPPMHSYYTESHIVDERKVYGVHAPSGAWLTTHDELADAELEAAAKNVEGGDWIESLRRRSGLEGE